MYTHTHTHTHTHIYIYIYIYIYILPLDLWLIWKCAEIVLVWDKFLEAQDVREIFKSFAHFHMIKLDDKVNMFTFIVQESVFF